MQTQGRRILTFVGVCAVLVPVAVWRIRAYLDETPSPPALPETEQFRSDAERLNRLRTASISAPREISPTAEWPQWRGPTRDGISGVRIADEWPAQGPRRLWIVPGGLGHSSLAISGGRVLTVVQAGEEEVVLCLDVATGESRWSHRYRAKFSEPYAGVGPHGTPTVADGRVYVVGATGLFHCLDLETGKVVWQRDLVRDLGERLALHGASVSPLLDGDRVIVQLGKVASYDRKDGRLIWKSENDPAGHSSPVEATIGGRRQLVALSGARLLGVSPEDGARLWEFPWTTQGNINIVTPIVAANYVFITSGYGKGCALVEVGQGPEGGFVARPVYEHNRMRSAFGTPVLYRDHLYGFDDLFLVCVEFRTGKVMWKQRGFGKGNVLLAVDRLIVLGEEGRLALVGPSPGGYRELGSAVVSKTRCWAPPSLAGGKIFLRDQESVACFDLEKPR